LVGCRTWYRWCPPPPARDVVRIELPLIKTVGIRDIMAKEEASSQWQAFPSRGLMYTDASGEERFFEPLEVSDDDNCLFESLVACGCDVFPKDASTLKEMVSKLSLDWYEKKMHGGLLQKLFEVKLPSVTSLPYHIFNSKLGHDDFDLLLVSLVMSVNIRCIYNAAGGLVEHNSRDVIKEFISTLEDAGIDTEVYNGALSEQPEDVWLYVHKRNTPMNPEQMQSTDELPHFYALKPGAVDAINKKRAFKGDKVDDENTSLKKIAEKPTTQRDVAEGENKKQTRRRLTMKEQYDIVQKFELNPKLGHKEVASEYGIARTTVSTLLKRKELIKMEIGAALIRDKTYEAKSCRRIFTSDYSQTKSIDFALYEWMSQRNTQEQLSSEVLKKQAIHFATKAGIRSFTASEGWLNGFKKRFGLISGKKRCRQSKRFVADQLFPDLGTLHVPQLDGIGNTSVAVDEDDLLLKKAKLSIASHGIAVEKSKETVPRAKRETDTTDIELPPEVQAALKVVANFAKHGDDEKMSTSIQSTLQTLENKLKKQQRKAMEPNSMHARTSGDDGLQYEKDIEEAIQYVET
jgi:hypothetical protein